MFCFVFGHIMSHKILNVDTKVVNFGQPGVEDQENSASYLNAWGREKRAQLSKYFLRAEKPRGVKRQEGLFYFCVRFLGHIVNHKILNVDAKVVNFGQPVGG